MISRKVGYKWGIGSSLGLLGQLALHRGDESTARSLLEEALAVRQEVRRPWGIAWGIYCLADLTAVQSDYVTAHTHYVECLALLRELDDKEFTASCLEGLGVVVVAKGDEDGSIPDILWAARLWGTAEAMREAIGAPISPIRRARYEQAIAIARTQLGEQAFVAAWAEGRIMTPQHILAVQGEVMIPTPMPTRPATPPMKSPSFPAGLTAREVDVLH